MFQIDLNCDLGESFGNYKIGLDEEVIPFITSANIACGFHASDPMVMKKTVSLAKQYKINIGAHPGFPDLLGFGRRNMVLSEQEAKSYMTYQIGALYGFCQSEQVALTHVKPHGALYNMAAKDKKLAIALCEAIHSFDPQLPILALSGSLMVEAAKEVGIPVIQEVFADRAYEDDGTLVARAKEGSMIKDESEAIRRVIRMVKEKKVTSINGTDIPIQADSVCVHGDGEKALLFVKQIKKALEENDILVKGFS